MYADSYTFNSVDIKLHWNDTFFSGKLKYF